VSRFTIKKLSPPGYYPGDESMMLRVTTPVHWCLAAPISTSTSGNHWKFL